MLQTSKNRAFTLIELLVVIAIIALLIGILLPALGKARASARQLKDSTQVRGVVQAMVTWAGNNQDAYPTPNSVDPDTTPNTTPLVGEGKNISSNIFSLLIFNGFISPELMVSPAEVSSSVAVKTNYGYSNPNNNPVALWDVSFTATGLDENTNGTATVARTAGQSNSSYAHIIPFGKRKQYWSNTFSATQAVFANRGPTYAAGDLAAWTTSSNGRWPLPTNSTTGDGSQTLQIHGGRTTWEGNVGYNDNHVNFETKVNPDGVTLTRAGQTTNRAVPDNIFVSETDEATTTDTAANGLSNILLRSYSKVDLNQNGQGAGVLTGNRWRD